jgi:hypothetical protein
MASASEAAKRSSNPSLGRGVVGIELDEGDRDQGLAEGGPWAFERRLPGLQGDRADHPQQPRADHRRLHRRRRQAAGFLLEAGVYTMIDSAFPGA